MPLPSISAVDRPLRGRCQNPTAKPQAKITSPVRNEHGLASQAVESTIVDPLRDSSWDDLVARFDDATPFHTAAWARVLSKTYGHKPVYLRFFTGDKTVGLLPLMEVRSPITGSRGVSLPFSDFCHPLISDSSITEALNRKLIELMSERRWKHVELRGGDATLFPDANQGASFYTHQLSLASRTSELWEGLADPVRRAIRKAVRSGVSVQTATTRSAMTEFYELHSQTRRRHGLPPQPLRFFLNIYDEIIGPGHGFILFARTGVRPIAAGIFFGFNGVAIYKFGASDDAFQNLRPNNLVMWEAIRILARRGCRTLHFGRTELTNDGLRRFKLGWGAMEGLIQYFRLGGAAPVSPGRGENGACFYHSLFRRLPLPINKIAGTFIYPHLD